MRYFVINKRGQAKKKPQDLISPVYFLSVLLGQRIEKNVKQRFVLLYEDLSSKSHYSRSAYPITMGLIVVS